MKPQRYHSVDPVNIDPFLTDDDWVLEQKLDGVRCVVTITDGVPVLTSNSGRRMYGASTQPWWNELVAELSVRFAPLLVLDGELLDDGTLWLFDVIHADEFVDPWSPFERRREVLEAIGGCAPWTRVRVVPQFRGEAKRETWHRLLEANAEGCVLKRLGSLYRRDGGRTREVLKVKRTYTVDVVVLETGLDGKDSSRVGLMRDGEMVQVGKVSMTPAAADVGTVIEVRFLYVLDLAQPALYQAVFLRARPDKRPDECEFDQLLGTHPDRTVHELVPA